MSSFCSCFLILRRAVATLCYRQHTQSTLKTFRYFWAIMNRMSATILTIHFRMNTTLLIMMTPTKAHLVSYDSVTNITHSLLQSV